jgi:hypothetical protein
VDCNSIPCVIKSEQSLMSSEDYAFENTVVGKTRAFQNFVLQMYISRYGSHQFVSVCTEINL